MKKILFLMCVIALSITALASCGEKCEHPVSEEWTSNAENHWHATTCEHGEFRQGYAAHADADEDGVCDVCAYEMGHTHTFSSKWSKDEEKHWKDATCSHTGEKAEESLHFDEDQNGKCDACTAHVHILDGAGFCSGCNKEIKPVDEYDVGSVIYATTARNHNVTGGTINYYQISRFADPADNGEIKHLVEYSLGTNGTYSKRYYDEVEVIGEHPNAYVQLTGETEILEKWVKRISADNVEGISAISVNGVYKNAEPSSFGPDDLAGYYYAISTLADGHGAEAVLASIYDAYVEYGIENAVVVHDDENNKYDFSFKALVVHETNIVVGGSGSVYNANYFEVSVSFTYAEDYTLKSLDVSCDVWTSDPGTDPNNMGQINKPEVDLQYDPETDTFIFVEYDKKNDKFVPATTTPRADSYKITVVQNVGTREEIELNDGSEFAPDSFEIFTDEELSSKASNLELEIGDTSVILYIGCTPADSFTAFMKNDLDIVVKDTKGNVTNGISVTLTGDVIYVIPTKAGSYVIEFNALGITRTVKATVTGIELGGEHTFELTTTTSYGWDDFYEFIPTTPGVYTFYLPAFFGIFSEDSNAPEVDPYAIDGNLGYNPGVPHTVTVTLKPGQTFRFNYGATTVGTFTIGYDAP